MKFILFAALLLSSLYSQANLSSINKITPETMCTEDVGDFEHIVDQGIKIILKKYPESIFYEAGVKLKSPVVSPEGARLTRVYLVFGLSSGRTAILHYTPPDFEDPVIFPAQYVGDCAIKWPLAITLADAITIKNAAGYKQPFSYVTLRSPLCRLALRHPGFIFPIQPRKFVFVDSVDGEIYPIKNDQT